MPVQKKNGMWWFGSQGPFYTKSKAEQVQSAAYASGYMSDESVDEFSLDDLPEFVGDKWITKNGGHIFIGKGGEVERPSSPGKSSSLSKKPSLTPTEKTYLSSYSGDDFLRINKDLREGKDSVEGVSKIDSAIEKNSVGVSTLYRGISREDAKKLFPDGHIKKGAVISDFGYSSTSKNRNVAGIFGVGGVLLQIETNPSAKGVDLSSLSSNKHEDEVLLPRGANMVVQSIHPPKEPGKPVVVKVTYGKKTANDSLALDRSMSRRRIDENGYLHVTQTHLTKEQIAPYFGKEIPGWEQHGLEPEKVYYGYRSGEELERAKDTFSGMPLLIIHKQDSAHAPLKEERVGSIGTTPVWDAPYLDNALTVTDQSAINAIGDDSLREISCGYFFEPEFTPGEFNGVHYDFVMRNIRGNHVALVKEGRAGPDVSVHDGLPSKLKVQKTMQLNRKQVAVRAALATFLMPRLTVDAAPAELTKLVGSYKKPASLAKAVSRQYSPKLAQDMDIEPEELVELIEATEGVVEPDEPKTEEADPTFDEDNAAESLKSMLEGKVPDELLAKLLECLSAPVGDDAEEAARKAAEEAAGKKDNEPAMDANAIAMKAQNDAMAKFRSLTEAGRKVRDLVGEVDVMAFDSAEDIYGHALKQKGINIKQYDKAAYKGMVDMLAANKPSTITSVVQDSTPVKFEGQFAGLANIKI